LDRTKEELMLVYRGEKRFLSADLAAVIADGDSLASVVSCEVIRKTGRGSTALLVVDPSPPFISGTEVRFWIDVPLETAIGLYLAPIVCDTGSGERIVEEAPIVIQ
jgi:hypothetical protein